MYSRSITYQKDKSFFLFGPRGVGKTAWIRRSFPQAPYFDLLNSTTYSQLLAEPARLETLIPKKHKDWILIDEVQRVPELLNEVHRLIESRRWKFVLTGSSARKLRRGGANLLAGRALTRFMYPLTAGELGADFKLSHALTHGCLPAVYTESDPKAYLQSYVTTYLREEVQQEGLTRNLGAFTRFLEAASYSQGSVLNMASVARECAVPSKVVEDYFTILEDLLLSLRIPVFTKRSKRRLVSHPKFYFFDCGIYSIIRPRGPLDSTSEIGGAALETLVLQQIRATLEYGQIDAGIYYWRTANQDEVDFVIYGESGLVAIEVKSSDRIRREDLAALRKFREDYPMARTIIVHAGSQRWSEFDILCVPVTEFLIELPEILKEG